MNRIFWKSFKVVCGNCGLSSYPRCGGKAQRSPKKGIAAALLAKLEPCRHCGKKLSPNLSDSRRPLIRLVRQRLIDAGFLAEDGQVIFPPPVDISPLETLAILDSLRAIQETHAPSLD